MFISYAKDCFGNLNWNSFHSVVISVHLQRTFISRPPLIEYDFSSCLSNTGMLKMANSIIKIGFMYHCLKDCQVMSELISVRN